MKHLYYTDGQGDPSRVLPALVHVNWDWLQRPVTLHRRKMDPCYILWNNWIVTI